MGANMCCRKAQPKPGRLSRSPGSVKSNCSILSALVDQQGGAQSETGLGDIPFKLTRSITQERKRRDRWENTQGNMFCMADPFDGLSDVG